MKVQDRFAKALSSLSRHVSKLHSTEICCGSLTREQFETLRTISASRDPSMTALSASLRVDLSTMSRNISVLEREKYVSRVRAADDSRYVTVVLTPRGASALQTLCCDEQDVMARLFRKLPADRRAALVDALETVEAALAAGDDASEEECCPAVPKQATR